MRQLCFTLNARGEENICVSWNMWCEFNDGDSFLEPLLSRQAGAVGCPDWVMSAALVPRCRGSLLWAQDGK